MRIGLIVIHKDFSFNINIIEKEGCHIQCQPFSL